MDPGVIRLVPNGIFAGVRPPAMDIRGGGARESPIGLGLRCSWACWRALAGARRTVVVAGPVVAGTDDDELVSGDRSSGAVWFGAAAHKRVS